jgi:hypothetical protein
MLVTPILIKVLTNRGLTTMVRTIVMREDGTVQYTANKVTRLSPGKYAVCLPKSLNDVWSEWHERGIKLLVIVKPITNPNPTQSNALETPRARAWESNRGAPSSGSGGQAPRVNDGV